MTDQTHARPRFVMLKSINGEPMLVNVASIRTVSTIHMEGTEFGVISFGNDHEVVIGSSVPEVLEAIEAAHANGPVAVAAH